MALIECPECNHDISSYAVACPICGYPLADDPMSAFNIFEILVKSSDVAITRGLFHNPSSPSTISSELFLDENRLFQRNEHEESKRSAEVDKLLASLSGERRAIRERFANSPSTPPEVLAKLARDELQSVRVLAAGNPATPTKSLANLASEDSYFVRERVAANPSTPLAVLATLTSDKHPDVRTQAAGNPSLMSKATSEDWVRDLSNSVSVHASPHTLKRLAGNASYEIRCNVANHPSTPADALGMLAFDKEETIRAYVASNPLTPANALGTLAFDEEEIVRAHVASNPSTLAETQAILAVDKSEIVREHLASCSSVSAKALAILVLDENEIVRERASGNPRLELLNDPVYRQDVCHVLLSIKQHESRIDAESEVSFDEYVPYDEEHWYG